MMKKISALSLITFGLLLFGTAYSQDTPVVEKKIYRWVDKKGEIHISDQLPPEANDQARKEYSAETGSLKGSVQPQLSPQQQELARLQAEDKAYAKEQAEMARRIENGLLYNYQTESDLKHAFDERADLKKQTIISVKASIQSRRAIIFSTLNELSDLELNGQPLPAEKITFLQNNHDMMHQQYKKLLQLKTELLAIQNEFSQSLEKYRLSKSGETQTVNLPASNASFDNKAKQTKQ